MTERLETARLALRPPEAKDAGAYAVMFGDPRVTRWLGDGTTLAPEQVPDRIERMRAHWRRYGVGLFSVLRKEDESVIGRVGLLLWDVASWRNGLRVAELRGQIETEIGWSIAHAEWGKGYATEAARAVRDWALGERGLRRLISLIYVGNDASVRVATKIGERLEREGIDAFVHPANLYALNT